LAYSDSTGDGTITQDEIKEENNYYPFGLKHKGYNEDIRGRDHKFGFGGKEIQDELGLEWYDVSARNYNAALGRWMNIDPLADVPTQIDKSPYQSVFNNPILFIDPDGRRVVNNDEDEAQAIVDDLNKIYEGFYGVAGVFSIKKRTKSKKKRTNNWFVLKPSTWTNAFADAEYEEVEVTDYVIEGSDDFDWGTDIYTEALSAILKTKADIEVDIVPDKGTAAQTETVRGGVPKGMLAQLGGGWTVNNRRIILSDKLSKSGLRKDKLRNEKIEWTIGAVTLHELLFHISPLGQGQINQGPNKMRNNYKFRTGSFHYPGSNFRGSLGKKKKKK